MLKYLDFNYALVPGGAKYLGNGQLSHPHFILTLPIQGEYGLTLITVPTENMQVIPG